LQDQQQESDQTLASTERQPKSVQLSLVLLWD